VDAAELSAALEASLRDRLDSPSARVEALTRLSAGASRQTWAFDLHDETPGSVRRLILQRERRGGGSGAGMAVEADLMRAAAVAGVPVPSVIATGDELDAAFVVTERIDGETIPRKLLRDDEFAAVRPRLAGEAGVALAAVHTIPIEQFEGRLEQRDQIEQFREVLDMLGEPHPAFELGFRWLERNRPSARPATVVHGDFRNGNLIVGPDRLRAVLDWELAHLGDPVEDLGWFCVRAWRFGSPHRAGGFGSVQDLVNGYRSASGEDVDLDAVRWWEVMGTLKWGVICMVQASAHLSGATRSVELATIGRRTAENEHDLLGLIDSRGAKPKQRSEPEAKQPRPSGISRGAKRKQRSEPEVKQPRPSGISRGAKPKQPRPSGMTRPESSGPHDRPTMAELVEAVREFLETEVMESAESGLRFHARIAANALAIVERELATGADHAAAHAARLAGLGVADDRELAAAIRSGRMDDRWDEVVDAVADSVQDKLAVAHPGYVDPEPGDESVIG
jgi:aminoglycoside phosphotransferase (APT) family kinase protein